MWSAFFDRARSLFLCVRLRACGTRLYVCVRVFTAHSTKPSRSTHSVFRSFAWAVCARWLALELQKANKAALVPLLVPVGCPTDARTQNNSPSLWSLRDFCGGCCCCYCCHLSPPICCSHVPIPELCCTLRSCLLHPDDAMYCVCVCVCVIRRNHRFVGRRYLG